MQASSELSGFDGYELLDRLGEGSSGVVHRARQLTTQQLVAIKVLRAEREGPASGYRVKARFERETHLCARLHHPHIVRLLDKGQSASGQPFAVFEYVPGETLHQVLLNEGALAAIEAGALMGQVLDALVAAHAAGIVHRDLKPQNIMVSRSGARRLAKVLDFGIGAFCAEVERPRPRDLTLTSETVGTPRYAAPEQLRGEPPTVMSDLYSWALIMLECLTGTPAVGGHTLAEVYHAHLSSAELPIPAALLRHPLGSLLRRALSKQASRRGRSAEELLSRFVGLNCASLVGELGESGRLASGGLSAPTQDPTTRHIERRQITMLSYTLEIVAVSADADMEWVETTLHERIESCDDACLSWGAFAAGNRGSGRLMYFGYPQASDGASRSAARAALELLARVRRWNEQQEGTGIALALRGALHTSTFLALNGSVPTGRDVDTALRLEHLARPDEVLVTPETFELLACDFDLASPRRSLGGMATAPASMFQLQGEKEATAGSDTGAWLQQPALVGRQEELSVVRHAWANCCGEGAGAALVISGDPGIGKSGLAREACRWVLASGGNVARLRCTPEQRTSALYPFLAWIRSQFTAEEGRLAVGVQRLMATLEELGFSSRDVGPLLCSWLGVSAPAGSTTACHAPGRQRQLILDIVQSLMRQRANDRFLLVIEDVHWIDQTSREFISSLLQEGLPSGLLLVLTTRDGSVGYPEAQRIQLSGLSLTDSGSLLMQLLPPKTDRKSVVSRLAAKADGNPLYLTELAKAYLVHQERELERPGEVDPVALGVPPSLRDLLVQALDRTGPAKYTSQCAAAQGREFDVEVLMESALVEPAVVEAHIEQMELAGVVCDATQRGRRSFRFCHALLRDAAYESIARPQKEQLHFRVAQALESKENAGKDVLALHYAAARRFDLAATNGIQSAALSLSRGLQEESLSQIEQVRSWLPQLNSVDRQHSEIELDLIATQCLMSKYGWADSRVRVTAERCYQLLEGIDDHERGGATIWALATYHHVASDRARVRALAGQLHALARSSSSLPLGRAAYTIEGMGCWIDGRFEDAASCFEQVLAFPAATAEEDSALFGLDCRCWSMAALASVQWFLDDEVGALALAERAIVAAEELNHIPTLGLSLMYASFLCQHRGDRDGAGRICSRLASLSRRFGLPAVEAYCAIIDGWVRADRATVAQVLGQLTSLGCNLGQTYVGSILAELTCLAGEPREAVAVIEETLKRAELIDERYFVSELWLQRAQYELLAEDRNAPDTARRNLDKAIEQASAAGMSRTLRRAHELELQMNSQQNAHPPSALRVLDHQSEHNKEVI